MEENKIELHDELDSLQTIEIEETYLLPREEVIAKLEARQKELQQTYYQLKEEK